MHGQKHLKIACLLINVQVGLLKRECERQRLLREEMESELQGLQSQISIMHAALSEASNRKSDEFLEMKLRKDDAERFVLIF